MRSRDLKTCLYTVSRSARARRRTVSARPAGQQPAPLHQWSMWLRLHQGPLQISMRWQHALTKARKPSFSMDLMRCRRSSHRGALAPSGVGHQRCQHSERSACNEWPCNCKSRPRGRWPELGNGFDDEILIYHCWKRANHPRKVPSLAQIASEYSLLRTLRWKTDLGF